MVPSQKDLPPVTRLEKAGNVLERFHARERWEAWGPLLVGVVCGLIVATWRISVSNYSSIMRDVMPTAISVAAILAGFQGTTHSILLSMREGRVLRHLKQRGLVPRLVSFIKTGVVSLLGFVAVSLIALVNVATSPNIQPASATSTMVSFGARMLVAALAGIFIYSMLASIRIVQLVVKMLTIEDKAP